MTPKFAKIALTAVVLCSALGGLFWYSLQQDPSYYKHVDEVMAARTSGRASRSSFMASS